MVLRNQGQEVAKMPSVKPADSLALVPQQLASSQSVLFLTVDKPSLILLKSVVDKRGDRFQITPHKEAVVIECPTGGHFMAEDKGKIIKKGDKIQPAEQRCVGDEEVAQFQARGVGSLKVGWTKSSSSAKEPKSSGVIEGIEDEIETVDTLGLVRRDKVSKTHTVPLRLTHDKPGIYTVSLTSVTDSMHNTYSPSGHSAQKVYNVLPRVTAHLQCPSPLQLLVNKTVSIPIIISGGHDSSSARDITYLFRSVDGEVSTHSMKLSKKNELITVSKPGTYTLQDLTAQCSGGVIEPSSCRVELISPPALDMTVITLNEGQVMDDIATGLQLT
jgi:nucleoporin POM152